MINKTQSEFLFKNIIVIGLGLMGGSIAKACRKYGASEHILGFDIDEKQSDFALENKIIDGIYDFSQLSDNDLIIICSSLLSYENILQDIKVKITSQTLIIDIGSLQEFSSNVSTEILQEKSKNFIACHPIAGSEKSGVQNSDADLFLDKKTIISSSAINDKNSIDKIQHFWKKIGSKTEFIDSKKHDKIFALVSHLPQFLAFLAKEDFQNCDDEILNRHFRLQNSNLQIWQEIFHLNRDYIEYYLQFYLKNIDKILGAFKEEEYQGLRSRRSILVSCLLNIPDIKNFQKYAGSGFKDFTAIQNTLRNPKILAEDKESIIQFLNNLKEKIHEFKSDNS
ncbi:MAG: prephenate dehydrogenase [Myxococcota bacterium]|jgi:prephenate dehydrogenase